MHFLFNVYQFRLSFLILYFSVTLTLIFQAWIGRAYVGFWWDSLCSENKFWSPSLRLKSLMRNNENTQKIGGSEWAYLLNRRGVLLLNFFLQYFHSSSLSIVFVKSDKVHSNYSPCMMSIFAIVKCFVNLLFLKLKLGTHWIRHIPSVCQCFIPMCLNFFT